MCRHCVRNPQPGSSKTPKKGCFEKNEEGKAVQFNLGEQTKVSYRSILQKKCLHNSKKFNRIFYNASWTRWGQEMLGWQWVDLRKERRRACGFRGRKQFNGPRLSKTKLLSIETILKVFAKYPPCREDQLRDLMLSKYSYASIPYKKKRQVTSAGELKSPPSCHCCRV